MSQQEVYASDEDIGLYTDILSDPNDSDLRQRNQEIFEELVRKKFLLSDEFDELRALSTNFKKKKAADGHLGLGIVLTHDCNFRCGYCYQKHEDISLSDEDISRIKRFYLAQLDNREVKRVRITWWGGEPLMKRGAIYDLSKFFIHECSNRGIAYSAYTSTNGALLSVDVARKLKECQLNSYHITIDGPQKWHDVQRPNRGGGGTYKKVLGALKSLLCAYGEVSNLVVLRVNLSPYMLEDIIEWDTLVSDLSPFKSILRLNLSYIEESELGVAPDWSVQEFAEARDRVYSKFIESGFLIQNYDLSSGGFRSPGGLFCGAIHENNWMIMPDGRVSKCVVELHKPSHDSATLTDSGVLEMTSFGEAWRDYDPTENTLCATCDVLPVCMGGCKMLPLHDQSGSRCAIKATMQGNLITRMETLISKTATEEC